MKFLKWTFLLSLTILLLTAGQCGSVPINQVPTVNAGEDQKVSVNTNVTLTSTANDPEAKPLKYAWKITSKPTNAQRKLNNATKASSSFTPDIAGTYELSITVSDGQDESSDVVIVIADPLNQPPTVNAGEDQDVFVGNIVTLTGVATDPEGKPLNYSWVITSKPTNSQSKLNNANKISSSFTPIIAKPFSSSKKLVSPDPGVNDWFGYSVAITNTYALVGAYQADDKGSNSGAAYIYKRNGENWQYVQTLTASNGAALDNFGQIVVLTDTLAIVGARFGDGLVADSGAVYLFERTGEVWTEVQKLIAADGVAKDEFGFSIEIQGDYIFIGADEDDNIGSVYIFKKDGSTYAQVQKLQPLLGGGFRFGRSVAAFGNTLMVGRPGEDTLGIGSGAVYVYEKVGDAWSEVDTLTASDGTSGDRFGRAIEMNDRYAVISAVYDDALGSFASSAYIFELTNGVWSEKQKLTGNDTDLEDRFGHAVGLSGDYVMIGAYGAGDTGAVYVYKNLGSTWTQVNRLTPADLTSGDYLGADAKMIGNYIIAGARNHDVSANSANNAGAVYIFKK
jgi:hypothetical protein